MIKDIAQNSVYYAEIKCAVHAGRKSNKGNKVKNKKLEWRNSAWLVLDKLVED